MGLLFTECAGYEITTCGGEFYFDAKAAADAVSFIEELCQHSEGQYAGQPFILEPWQRQIVEAVWGWRRTKDSFRRFRRIFIFIPRKNGKTILCAALAVLILYTDGEPRSQNYAAASSGDQAALLFGQARAMIDQSPVLRGYDPKVQDSTALRKITVGSSFLRVVSSDGDRAHGGNSHAAFMDEIHSWDTAKHAENFTALATSQGTQLQPLLWMMTTAGKEQESLCFEEYSHAKRVLSGEVTDHSYLPVIYEAPMDAPWDDPKTWAMANPNLDVSIQSEALAEECERAKSIFRLKNEFRRLRLNQWVSVADAWLDMTTYDSSPAARRPDSEGFGLARGRKTWLGLDIGISVDLTAACWLQVTDDGIYRFRWEFWIPSEQVAIREAQDQKPYQKWIDEGWLQMSAGEVLDDADVISAIHRGRGAVRLQAIGIDPAFGRGIMKASTLRGCDWKKIPQTATGGRLNEAMRRFEAITIGGQVDHGFNPIARSHFSSTLAVPTADGLYIRPGKRKRKTEHIDGAMAALFAISAMLQDSEAAKMRRVFNA